MAKQLTFTERVYKALTSKFQTSRDIAAKLNLVGDDGKPTAYQCAKVTKSINDLLAEGKAVKDGAFRTAKYKKA